MAKYWNKQQKKWIEQDTQSVNSINHDENGNINLIINWNNIEEKPSSMPASDVYEWAKASKKPTYNYSEITGTPSSLPASDVYSWAKATTKPTYTADEVGAIPSNGTAVNSTKLGGMTLDQIKELINNNSGGDFVGKDIVKIFSDYQYNYTYTNAKGGLAKISVTTNEEYDYSTDLYIDNDQTKFSLLREVAIPIDYYFDNSFSEKVFIYELTFPFNNSFKISGRCKITGLAYINK